MSKAVGYSLFRIRNTILSTEEEMFFYEKGKKGIPLPKRLTPLRCYNLFMNGLNPRCFSITFFVA
jgi:hypothetical protein